MLMNFEFGEYSKSRFEAAMYEISFAEKAHERGEREKVEEHLNNARELFKEVLDKDLAAAGLLVLDDVQRDIEITPNEHDDGHENSTESKFEKIWKWCLDLATDLNLEYEWDDDLKRIVLPKKDE